WLTSCSKVVEVTCVQAGKYVNVIVNQTRATQNYRKNKRCLPNVEIGTANCPNPEQVLIPPKRGDTAKASPNV
ncbi:hypothetical protein KUCAC02_001352, partial [Chaenocephalus aceratus]